MRQVRVAVAENQLRLPLCSLPLKNERKHVSVIGIIPIRAFRPAVLLMFQFQSILSWQRNGVTPLLGNL